MSNKKDRPKEIFYLKADKTHYKIIENMDIKIREIRLTDKVEKFSISRFLLDGYLEHYKLVSRKEILNFISKSNLNYHLPEIQLSLHFQQGKLF
jgi:hypothetical protein